MRGLHDPHMITGSPRFPNRRPPMRLLALLLLLAATPAGASIHLRVDLDAGRVEFTGPEVTTWTFDPASVRADLAAFHQGLVAGTWDADLAASLGTTLLGPASAVLDTAGTWSAEPLAVAPLDALILPGDDGPLGRRATVRYRPSVPSTRPVPRGGLLVVNPFIPGNENPSDDPFHLYKPMRRQVRHDALIPRDDSTPPVAAAVLAEEPTGLVWLRSTPAQAQTFLTALRSGPPLLLWTRSEEELLTCPLDRGTTQAVCVAWADGGGAILADLWPVDERSRAEATADLVGDLTRGVTGFEAYRRARLALAAARPVPQWAGWIHVGDPTTAVELVGPSWWQRLWQR